MHPFRRRALRFLGFEAQFHMDAPDHQHSLVIFDFANGIGHQAAAGRRNLTRLQRAPEGSGQSAGGAGNDVVQGCGVRLGNFRRHPVVRRHGAMHAENRRLPFRRQEGPPQGPFDAFDAHFGAVCDGRHAGAGRWVGHG